MPGFVVTRGLGPGATPSNLIVRGFIPAVEEAINVYRGSRVFTEKAKQGFADLLEDLKVSVALVAINGKDLLNPIINKVHTTYRDEPTPRIEVIPTKLSVRQPDIKVKVTSVRSNDVNN